MNHRQRSEGNVSKDKNYFEHTKWNELDEFRDEKNPYAFQKNSKKLKAQANPQKSLAKK